jgi:hypothetical protein
MELRKFLLRYSLLFISMIFCAGALIGLAAIIHFDGFSKDGNAIKNLITEEMATRCDFMNIGWRPVIGGIHTETNSQLDFVIVCLGPDTNDWSRFVRAYISRDHLYSGKWYRDNQTNGATEAYILRENGGNAAVGTFLVKFQE